MNLDEWRKLKSEGEDAQLPSGLVVRLKRVGLADLAAQGKIPQTLQPAIDDLTNLTKRGDVPSVSKVGELSGVLDVVCGACLVGPEGLLVSELDFTDKMAIFSWANEVAAGLKTFRSEQVKPLGVGLNGAALRTAA